MALVLRTLHTSFFVHESLRRPLPYPYDFRKVVFPWHLFYFSFSFFRTPFLFQPGVMPPVVAFAVGEC